MINKKNSRVGKIGASDTYYVMSNWETKTFMDWWQSKLGIKDISFSTTATIAGTYKEHQIAEWYATKFGVKIKKDRRVKVDKVLVVNLDCETKDLNIEIKTHKQTDKEWKLPKNYHIQTQVQTYACHKPSVILAYALTEEDYENFFLPIDESRIQIIPIEYDKEWVENEYLPRLKYLSLCLRHKKTPNLKEFEKEKECKKKTT